MSFDLIIRNGTIIDGTGNAGYKGDIGLKDGKIKKIRSMITEDASKEINAIGMVICPGFIDMHSHTDFILPIFNTVESFVRQGITTNVIGMCGNSFAPIHPERVEEFRKFYARTIPLYKDYVFTWNTFGEYLEKLEKDKCVINIVPVVGFENIRIAGGPAYDNRPPSSEEYERMKEYIIEAMEAGAFGMSTGLIYAPQVFAKTEEIIELAKAVAQYNGLYFSHIRGEGEYIIDAVNEVIEIVEKSKCRGGHIAHHKISGKPYWGKSKDTLKIIEEANKRGISITYDQYPYNRGFTSLTAILPPWIHEGGPDALLESIKQTPIQERIKEDTKNGIGGWENFIGKNGFENIFISSVVSEKWKDVEGKSLTEISQLKELNNEWDTMFSIIIDDEGGSTITVKTMSEEDIRRIMKGKYHMIGTDGLGIPNRPSLGKYHPRFYGTYPRILGRYVREENLLTLEDAIRRMTSFPALRLGIPDRGLIKENFSADIVIFNPETILDKATFEDPHQFPEGMPYIIVNGIIVVDNNKQKRKFPGKVLRRFI
ncbi:MAG: amidohydrolase family protein [Candidatus Odinarchaeota archaeon]